MSLEVLAAFLGAALLLIPSLMFGASIGGNFATDFTFAGNRGYEATGVLAAFFGLPIGGFLGSYICWRKLKVPHSIIATILLGIGAGLCIFLLLWGNQIYMDLDEIGTGHGEYEAFEIHNLTRLYSISIEEGDKHGLRMLFSASGLRDLPEGDKRFIDQVSSRNGTNISQMGFERDMNDPNLLYLEALGTYTDTSGEVTAFYDRMYAKRFQGKWFLTTVL